MATKRQKRKCSTCGGYCGGNKRTGCKFADNETKRRQDELWAYVTAGRDDDKPIHGCVHMQVRGAD